MDGKYRLNFELVPDCLWGCNLRSILTKSQWDTVRRGAYSRAGGKCMICGAKCGRLEAHERWEYDEEKHVQRLADIIAVCRRCHEVIHIGRTQLMGRGDTARAHFMKVNGCSYADYIKALGEANRVNARRNLIDDWKTDITCLNRFM